MNTEYNPENKQCIKYLFIPKAILVIAMLPFVILFGQLLLTVAPVFAVLYAGLILYGLFGTHKK